MEDIKKESKTELLEKIDDEKVQEALDSLGEGYVGLIKILKKYCDLEERYYNLIAVWIIGTYFHRDFLTYPYLFFNAMKGSGKTRILHLISKLMYKGKLQVNMTESVLFRQAEQYGFCIDEVERINTKEMAPLRELLNTAYKKGMNIERSIQKKNKLTNETSWEIETHKTFTPICMANIRGVGDVLADRSVVMILNKSNKNKIVRSIETFDFDDDIIETKKILCEAVGVVGVVVRVNTVLKIWNHLIHSFYNIYNITTPNNTNDTNSEENKGILSNSHTKPTSKLTPNNTDFDTKDTIEFFERIIAHTQIAGRNLELFLPLFIIANLLKGEILEETIKTAERLIEEKKSDDVMESRDVQLLDFVAREQETPEFIALKGLIARFKEFLQEEEAETKYLNSKWFGNGLKRLGLIEKKRRLGKGREIILNFKKAKNQMRIYRTIDKEEEKEPNEAYDENIANAVAEDMRDALKETASPEPEKVENKVGLDNFT